MVAGRLTRGLTDGLRARRKALTARVHAVGLEVGVVGADRRLEVQLERACHVEVLTSFAEKLRKFVWVSLHCALARVAGVRAFAKAAEAEVAVVREVDSGRALVLHPGERPPVASAEPMKRCVPFCATIWKICAGL